MAALTHPAPEIVDLRRLASPDLNPLLEEETLYWRQALDWDFARSADLVRKYVDLRALTGAALIAGGQVVGYAYTVVEEQKGIVGDLYISSPYRSPENEYNLLSSVIESLIETPLVTRIESQLILFGSRERRFPRQSNLQKFERQFLEIDLADIDRLPQRVHPGISIDVWQQHLQEAAAHLIASSYSGHIDSLINDQYRSVSGARRFLFNIVQFPGCGTFLEDCSLAAFEKESGWLCGLCLVSQVSEHVGHVTQICVSRDARGRGLGYEMLRQSLVLMRFNGCAKAGLTVTTANRAAVELYQRTGFRCLRRFPALVWEGF